MSFSCTLTGCKTSVLFRRVMFPYQVYREDDFTWTNKATQSWETIYHYVQNGDTSQCSNLLSECHSCPKSQNGTWPSPRLRTHSCIYFQPRDPCQPPPPPATPPLSPIVKLEPVNSWGGVSFDKCSGSLLSCRHIEESSVWSQTMCVNPSRISGHSLHPRWHHPPHPSPHSPPFKQASPFKSTPVSTI